MASRLGNCYFKVDLEELRYCRNWTELNKYVREFDHFVTISNRCCCGDGVDLLRTFDIGHTGSVQIPSQSCESFLLNTNGQQILHRHRFRHSYFLLPP